MKKKTSIISETESEAKEIAMRIKNRDFSGNTGTAIKNSAYFMAKTLVAKFGSLIFVIVLARLLAPELYGLYGLALSTILFLSGFSELGIGSALSTFLSKHIDKRKGKAKGYFVFLTRIKVVLVFVGALAIVLSAHFFANVYYDKPIFYALLAGGLYYPISYLSRYLGTVFMAKNDFKVDFLGEFIFQGLRFTLVPLVILYLIPRVADANILLLYIFLTLTLCFLVTGIYYLFVYLHQRVFKGVKAEHLNKKEKSELFYFILPLAFTSFSGIFFGFVDTIMLGYYVASEYIAYYQAALHLIVSASVIISFSGTALFPVFSRLKGEKLKRGFRKTRNLTALLSIAALIVTVIIAPYVVWFVYGSAYSPAVLLLRIFSLLLISFPLNSLYQTYYTSQKKTTAFSILLFLSTVLNVVLNFIFINIGFTYGVYEAVIGACIATIASRYAYLFSLAIYKKKIEKDMNG